MNTFRDFFLSSDKLIEDDEEGIVLYSFAKRFMTYFVINMIINTFAFVAKPDE